MDPVESPAPPPSRVWMIGFALLTGANFLRLLPIVLGFHFFLIADPGWSLATDAEWADRGAIPTQDFSYFYGLLTLVIDRGWFALVGRTPQAVAALYGLCNGLAVLGLLQFGRGMGLRPREGWFLAIAAPIAIMPLSFPSPTHALEEAFLALALGFHARGRLTWALPLVVAAIFIKPSLAGIYALLLIASILTRPESWGVRLRSFLPGIVTGVVLTGTLIGIFGIDPLIQTMIPRAAARVYVADNYGFFFGVGRLFWLPSPFNPLYYLLTPAGFWIVCTLALIGLTVPILRHWRDPRAQVVIILAILHLAFVTLLYGNQHSWIYYAYMLIAGTAGALAWHRDQGRQVGPLTIGLTLLALLGQLAATTEAIRVWSTAQRSEITAGLYDYPDNIQAWEAIRNLGKTKKVLVLTRSGAPTMLAPEVQSPRGWYLLRASALPQEIEQVREQIRSADYLVLPKAPDAALTWPEHYGEEFKAFGVAKDFPQFLVVVRSGR